MVGKCHKNDLLMNLSEFKIFPNLVTMKTVKRYYFEVVVQYRENLYEPPNDLPFLLEIKKVDKVKKNRS